MIAAVAGTPPVTGGGPDGFALSFYGVATQVTQSGVQLLTANALPGDDMPGFMGVGWDFPSDTGVWVPALLNLYRVGSSDCFAVQNQLSGGYLYLTIYDIGSVPGYPNILIAGIDQPWSPEAFPPAVPTPVWSLDSLDAQSYDQATHQNTYTGFLKSCSIPPIYLGVLQPMGPSHFLMGFASPFPSSSGTFQLVWFTLADILATGSSTFGSVVVPFRCSDLHGLSLGTASWRNTDFSNANLSNASFAQADMSGATFIGANITGTCLSGTILASTELSGFDLTVVDVSAGPAKSYRPPLNPPSKTNPLASLVGSRLNQSLFGNDWSLLDLTNATILNLNSPLSSKAQPLLVKYSRLVGVNGGSLAGLSLQYAAFDSAILDGLDLHGVDLTNASLIQTSLHGANLTNGILTGANLAGAQLGTLSRLFTLPMADTGMLNSGPSVDPALSAVFLNNGIALSTTATLQISAADRVWSLNDAGNNVIYSIRLETQSDGNEALVVYKPGAAASLVNAYLPNAILSGANLFGVVANNIQFYGPSATIDRSAILEEANLNDSNLSTVNFTQAKLFGVNLSNCQLFNARFNKADLSPSATGAVADLSNANLQGVDFTDAFLYGANLANAAVAIGVPTAANPNQGGVYLFSLPFAGDHTSCQQYQAELNAGTPSLPLTTAGFAHYNYALNSQATASIDTPAEQWLIDNDSTDPNNTAIGYMTFILKLNGSVLDIYGASIRIVRLAANGQQEFDTEMCNVTTLAKTNFDGNSILPNGVQLSVNQTTSGVPWDPLWLRAGGSLPSPPPCVPSPNSWCAPTQGANAGNS
jgi:uncharacterized protein YjbI with pentapeptide repeats